ncbi:MAG: thiamine phosphate synthase, partial [Halanaerobium sp. MSAO_Bac5]
ISIPITAIGGIKLNSAYEVIRAGADNIAVISALTQAADIKSTAQDFKKMIHKAKKQRTA